MIFITKSDDSGFDVKIGSSEYRFDTSNGYPIIFSKNSKLSVPNVDGWCLSQTQGKLSYKELQLMAEAYKQGYKDGLQDRDIRGIEIKLCETVIHEIFERGHIDDLMDLYWVECFKKSNFISKFVPQFIKDLDSTRSRYGDDNIRRLMDRIKVRLEILNQYDLIRLLVEKYRSLNIDPSDPVYPNVKAIAESIIDKSRVKDLIHDSNSTFA